MTERRRPVRRVRCKCGNVFMSRKELDCKRCRLDVTKQRLISKLQSFAVKHGRAPTARELGAGIDPNQIKSMPSYSALQYAFGSFKAALLAAGLTPRPIGARLKRDGPLAKTELRRNHQPRRIPIEWRNDFLLALPELRRELARALEYDGSIQVGDGEQMPRRRSA